jgi:hypothetical protein
MKRSKWCKYCENDKIRCGWRHGNNPCDLGPFNKTDANLYKIQSYRDWLAKEIKESRKDQWGMDIFKTRILRQCAKQLRRKP